MRRAVIAAVALAWFGGFVTGADVVAAAGKAPATAPTLTTAEIGNARTAAQEVAKFRQTYLPALSLTPKPSMPSALKKIADDLKAFLRTADATLDGSQREYLALEKDARPANVAAWRERMKAASKKTLATTSEVKTRTAKAFADLKAARQPSSPSAPPPPPPSSSSSSTLPPGGTPIAAGAAAGGGGTSDQQAADDAQQAISTASQQAATQHDIMTSLIQGMTQ